MLFSAFLRLSLQRLILYFVLIHKLTLSQQSIDFTFIAALNKSSVYHPTLYDNQNGDLEQSGPSHITIILARSNLKHASSLRERH